MKKILIIIGIILVIIFAVFIFNNYYQSPKTMQPVSNNTIIIKNFAFNPSSLTIKTGTTITWINQDNVTHTIKSSDFNSQNLQPGDEFQFTFNQKGVFNYSCGIHPSMTGQIVVE